MAALVRERPDLLTRLAFAPPSAVHASGAWLHFAPEAARSDSELAELLDTSDPRALLRAAIPDAPAGLYRALGTAGDRVRERAFYERVATLCRTPFGDWLLSGDLDDDRVDHAAALLKMDPLVGAVHAALPYHLHLTRSLDAVIAFLRAHDVLSDTDLRLPSRAGLRAIVRRVQQALERIPAPHPGFNLPPPFHIIRTVRELRRKGLELQNCVGKPRTFATDYWFRLISGSMLFITCDAPVFLAAFRLVGPGLWQLEQMSGHKNALVDEPTRERLFDAMRLAGARILEDNPGHALSLLWSYAERGRETAGNLDEADIDWDPDWAA